MTPHCRRLGGLVLAAVILAAGPAVTANAAVTNTPSRGATVVGPGCLGNTKWNSPDQHFYWGGEEPIDGDGDYTGSEIFGFPFSEVGSCTSYSMVYTSTTGSSGNFFAWQFGQGAGDGSVAGHTCYVWAYITDGYASARAARYDVWGVNSSTGAEQWLFWPGYNVNQNNLTGWIYFGEHAMGSNDTVLVTLGNHDSMADTAVGAGAMAFECN